MGQRIKNPFIYAILIIGTIIVFYPVMLMLITSFKTYSEIVASPGGLPVNLHFSNYMAGLTRGGIARASLNSLFYTVTSVACIVVVSSLAAYVLTRFTFRGQGVVKFYFLSGLMIPFQVALLPLFKLMKTFGLFNNVLSVILIYTTVGIAFAFFLYTGYLKGIPKDIEESAYIDGCSYYRIFWSVIMPLIHPATATVVIFNILYVWNDFFVPLIFISDKKLKPVQLAIYTFVGEFSSDWGIVFACMTMAALPVILCYLFMQRFFISGVMAGAVKG